MCRRIVVTPEMVDGEALKHSIRRIINRHREVFKRLE